MYGKGYYGRLRPRMREAIDLQNPLLPHPLNLGRLVWWLATPGRYGGPLWWDLVGKTVSQLNAGALWSPLAPVSGRGSIQFNGSSSYVAVAANLFQLTNFTAACWFRTNGTIAAEQGLFRKDTQVGATRYLFGITVGSTAAGTVDVQFYNGATLYTATTSPTRYDDGKWHRAVGVWVSQPPNSSVNVLIDGKFVTGTFIGNQTLGPPTGEMDIGALPPNSGGGRTGFFNGWIDDVTFWNRNFGISDVATEFQLGQESYLGLLKRKQRAYPTAGAAAPPSGHFQAAWPYRAKSPSVIGSGIY